MKTKIKKDKDGYIKHETKEESINEIKIREQMTMKLNVLWAITIIIIILGSILIIKF
jgi:hypothetical protein